MCWRPDGAAPARPYAATRVPSSPLLSLGAGHAAGAETHRTRRLPARAARLLQRPGADGGLALPHWRGRGPGRPSGLCHVALPALLLRRLLLLLRLAEGPPAQVPHGTLFDLLESDRGAAGGRRGGRHRHRHRAHGCQAGGRRRSAGGWCAGTGSVPCSWWGFVEAEGSRRALSGIASVAAHPLPKRVPAGQPDLTRCP